MSDDFSKLGFTELNGKSYSYYFNDQTFRITLIPQSIEERDKAYFEQFESIGHIKRKNEWIPSNIIKAEKLVTHSQILFSMLDNPSTHNGIAQYPVNWYIELPDEGDIDLIDGIDFIGGDVNNFYNPNHAIERTYDTDSFSVKASFKQTADCGTFDFDMGKIAGDTANAAGGVKAEISESAEITGRTKCSITVFHSASSQLNNFDSPLVVKSFIRFELSRPVNLEECRKLYTDARGLFLYLSCRNNVHFDDVRLIWKHPVNKHPDYHVYGKVHFPVKDDPDDDPEKQRQIIDHEQLGVHTADLVSYIHQDKVGFQFICDSARARHSYPPSRVIAICTEFEREFRNIYGTDTQRHELYKATKEEIVNLLESKAAEATGNKKQYIKSFAKTISNSDDKYSQRVQFALDHNKEVITPFIDRIYIDDLENMKDGIADRLNDIRNGLAHSRLDFELEPVNLSDIQILEMLSYVIVLQQYLEPVNVIRALSNLYDIRLFIKDPADKERGQSEGNE